MPNAYQPECIDIKNFIRYGYFRIGFRIVEYHAVSKFCLVGFALMYIIILIEVKKRNNYFEKEMLEAISEGKKMQLD